MTKKELIENIEWLRDNQFDKTDDGYKTLTDTLVYLTKPEPKPMQGKTMICADCGKEYNSGTLIRLGAIQEAYCECGCSIFKPKPKPDLDKIAEETCYKLIKVKDDITGYYKKEAKKIIEQACKEARGE